MEDIEWNVNNEGMFLEAMVGHKPVGVNKYFQMAFICDKFADYLQKEVSSEKLWSHLGTMYNLDTLDENESIPFPNTEKDFTLPDSDFGTLISRKDEEKKSSSSGNNKGRETPKNVRETPKKDEKPQSANKNNKEKEITRRDSKDSKTPVAPKKEIKKDTDPKSKGKNNKGPEGKGKGKFDDTPKPSKRPTRGSLSLKSDDSNGSGKSSPVNATNMKRRRI